MQVVYTGTDGALYGWDRARSTTARLTWPWEEAAPSGPPVGLQYGWPTCSRDGRRILTLARRGGDRHFVYVVDAAGVLAEEVVALGDAAPVYANWAPDAARVAVLVHRGDTLSLEVVDLAGERRPRVVARGAPLFWSWAPDGRTLAVHCGQSARDMSVGGTFLVDVESGDVREVVSRVPALYRAPSWSADGRWLAFARLAERGTRLVMLDITTGERRTRELERGPVAFLWHPRLPRLAYALARDEAPHVYERVVLLDLVADEERTIARPILACCWHPERPLLFRLAIDASGEMLAWDADDGGDAPRPVARFTPTRETVFAASFFDQYAASHGPVAPDGSALAIAGRLREDDGGDAPRVYVVATEGAGEAVALGDGVYSVWAR